ncbi:MAG: hypothetical protein WA771_09070 [Chthoniobacterales bacterium]
MVFESDSSQAKSHFIFKQRNRPASEEYVTGMNIGLVTQVSGE